MSATVVGSQKPNQSEPEILATVKEKIRQSIRLGAQLNGPFVVMNSLATIVASYGLLSNSTAVVIGAMIIAMLLGPIMGLALAMVDGDSKLLKNALLAELAGAGLVLALGFILGKVHSDIPLTDEILSRTKPNLLDLIVALGGGSAGAYATVSPRLSVGLVGVAIATALVPPLASCGICLAHGQNQLASGAALLFLTNLVAIQCASSVVLFIFGYHKDIKGRPKDRAYIGRLIVDGLLLGVLATFLFVQLTNSISQEVFQAAVKKSIERGLEKIPSAYLAETRFQDMKQANVVVAVVHAPNSVTPAQALTIEENLPKRGSRKTELHIRSILTKEVTPQGYLNVIDPNIHRRDGLEDEVSPDSEQDSGTSSQTTAPRR